MEPNVTAAEAVTKRASELQVGDHVLGDMLPLGMPGEILYRRLFERNRSHWMFVAFVQRDGFHDSTTFLADAPVRVQNGKAPRVAEPDPLGMGYTRADDEAVDPTPTGPREPMHTGAMTDEGLVDETERNRSMGWDGPCVPSLHITTPGESCLVCDAEGMRYAEHVEVSATAAETCSALCACGTEVSGFDTLAEASAELAIHVRDALTDESAKQLTSCARCGQPLSDDNCPDECRCDV